MVKYNLVIFDMDGTLLNGRTIFFFAEEKGFKKELIKLINSDICSYKKSIKIAKFLKDIKIEELLQIFRKIPLQNNVETVLKEIKKKLEKFHS